MTFTPQLAVTLLFAHFVGDFLLQTRWMADNKSKHTGALALHVLVYTMTLVAALRLIWATWQPPPPQAQLFQFFALNFTAHLIIDAFASQIRDHFHEKGRIHALFAVIGFEQFAHVSTLMLTAGWFL